MGLRRILFSDFRLVWRNFLGFEIFRLGGSFVGFLELCGWRRALVLRQNGISGYDDFSTEEEEEEEEEVPKKFS